MIVLLHQIIYSNVIQSTTMPHNYRIKTNIMVCFKKLNVFQTVNLASIEQLKCGITWSSLYVELPVFSVISLNDAKHILRLLTFKYGTEQE